MFSSSAPYASPNYWKSEKLPFSNADSLVDTGLGLRPSSDSSGRSCSPTDSPVDHQLQFESVFAQQQALPMRPAPGAYLLRQPAVGHFPGSVDMAWSSLSQQTPAFNNPSPPKRFVFEVPHCCATPSIRILHDCCNKETTPRDLLDNRRYPPLNTRQYLPTAPSKLFLCRFCLKNGEPPSLYYGHNLHTDGKVSCPILRRYDCPICNSGGGDFAHTVRYCPRLRAGYRLTA